MKGCAIMSLLTIEVELDHGRVTPRGSETLPDHGSALPTLLAPQSPDPDQPAHDPLTIDPETGGSCLQ
jgi:hypothetical protein